MSLAVLVVPAVLWLSLTGLILLIARDWRLLISALVIQYVGVFVLISLSWPLEMAAVKLVTGWMSSAVLGVALIGTPGDWGDEHVILPTGIVFRFFTALLVGLGVASIVPQLESWWPQVQPIQLWGGMIMMGMGILQLGLTSIPFRTILGLLTVMSGFEILYATMEESLLVVGLLAMVNLGLSLTGSYILEVPAMEGRE